MKKGRKKVVEDAMISAIRLRFYWLSQGKSREVAVKRSVKQACGMLASSGIPPRKLQVSFAELEEACEGFKETLESEMKGNP